MSATLLVLALFVDPSPAVSLWDPPDAVVGTVLDEAGQAVPGAVVTVQRIGAGAQVRVAVADGTGRFTVPGICSGVFEVKVEHPRHHRLTSTRRMGPGLDAMTITLRSR